MVSRTIKIPFLSPWGDLGIGLVSNPSILSTQPNTATFWYECWNLIQTELNYQWWVLSCSQDDVRCFQMVFRRIQFSYFFGCSEGVLNCSQILYRHSQMCTRCVQMSDVCRCSWMFSKSSLDALRMFSNFLPWCSEDVFIICPSCSQDVLMIS